MYILLADLHLGAGDDLEDFLNWGTDLAGPASHLRLRARLELDELFARFLAVKMAQARSAGLLPTLLLLGEIVDIWQNRRPRERPRKTLERILAAHLSVTGALQDWLAAGGEIEFLLGAHDRPMANARAWAFLRDTFPGINASHAGKPRANYRNEAAGLYAEHGHRFDPHYRMTLPPRPQATCIGHEFVRRVLRPFEPLVPCIDKATCLADTIRLAQAELRPDLLREAFRALAAGIRQPSFLLHVLHPWLEGRLADWRRVAAREQRGMAGGVERLRSRTGECFPAHTRFIATAHTHTPGRTLDEDSGTEFLTPGTWKPAARFCEGHTPRVEQPLSYGQLVPDGMGGWEASVRSWAAEAESA